MSLPLQTCNNLERRRTRAAGAEVKEDEGVENEDGAGNAPIPHNSGIGVSTRRTSYVLVSKRNHFVSSTALNLLFLFVCFVSLYLIYTLSHRMQRLLKKRTCYPTCLPQLLLLNLHDLPSLGLKAGSLATDQAHPSVPGGSAKLLLSRLQLLLLLLLQHWQ